MPDASTITLWRIQDSEGVGPYNSKLVPDHEDWQSHIHGPYTGQPGPWSNEDTRQGMLAWDRDARFGFVSQEQLERWFDWSERQKLAALGFVVVQVRIAECYVRQSPEQCCYDGRRGKP